jgi:osmotically-inducible protein OsmY
MRKLLISLGLIALGGLFMYLMDPDRGRSRRARFTDQAGARSRDITDTVSAKARYQTGVVKGLVHEVADVFTPGEANFDDETLRQKVRSEAIGPARLAGSDVQIDVSGGEVSVTGSLGDEHTRKRLIKSIERVEGVESVDDRLQVAARS